MTREQKAWFEFGKAYAFYSLAKGLIHRFPSQTAKQIPETREIIQAAWDTRREAHAWIPTHRRQCATCALCCRDADFPGGWYCEEIDESVSEKFGPDEVNCCLWRPKKGGAQ